MKNKLTYGIFLAILAAALYAVNSPFSKLLLDYMPSTLMAGFLYETAKLFSKFYQQCSIMNAETNELAKARLYLAESTLQVMKNAMNLVLIPYLEKM